MVSLLEAIWLAINYYSLPTAIAVAAVYFTWEVSTVPWPDHMEASEPAGRVPDLDPEFDDMRQAA